MGAACLIVACCIAVGVNELHGLDLVRMTYVFQAYPCHGLRGYLYLTPCTLHPPPTAAAMKENMVTGMQQAPTTLHKQLRHFERTVGEDGLLSNARFSGMGLAYDTHSMVVG